MTNDKLHNDRISYEVKNWMKCLSLNLNNSGNSIKLKLKQYLTKAAYELQTDVWSKQQLADAISSFYWAINQNVKGAI